MSAEAWKHAEELAGKHGVSKFVRLAKDGEKIVGVFCGVPYPREMVWTGERYVGIETPEGQKLLEQGTKASFRALMNFWVLEEGLMRVFEMGSKMFKDILKLREKYGLDGYAYEIERRERRGASPQVTYPVLPERRLTDEENRRLEATPLHNLEEVASGTPKLDNNYKDDTIGADGAQKLLPRLKELPKELLGEFLGRFGIQRIRDLRTGQLAEAERFVGELEARLPSPEPSSSGAQEVDPFAE